ncbi:hypothetical protein U9I18_000126 [Bacillus phage KKP_4048]
MTNIKSQDPISQQDLQDYFRFIVHQEVKDAKHAKKLKRISRRVATMSDTTLLFKALNQQQEAFMGKILDALMIQEAVLRKLGATDEMFTEAAKEYHKAVDEKVKEQKELKDKQEEAKEKMKEGE